jgi:hypothetical protein
MIPACHFRPGMSGTPHSSRYTYGERGRTGRGGMVIPEPSALFGDTEAMSGDAYQISRYAEGASLLNHFPETWEGLKNLPGFTST